MSADSYFTKLNGLWDKRGTFCPISSCHWDTMKEELSYRETQKIIGFLVGLTKYFEVTADRYLQ